MWLKENQITLDTAGRAAARPSAPTTATLLVRQRAFGYTDEDLKMILGPMAEKGEEPIGSMGTDTPLACLSDKPQPLFNYFKQLFAQVTNPPIDPIREEMVMSLTSYIGTERNILDETPQHCHTLKLPQPILTNRDLEKLRRVSQGDFLATTLPTLFPVEDGGKGLERALEQLCRRASLAIQSGYTLLILSDRGVDEDYAPIPSLLALTAVHNHLVREETAHAGRADHRIGRAARGHALRAADRLRRQRRQSVPGHRNRGDMRRALPRHQPALNYIKAINKGLLKTFSKMGISTLQSYRGAQVFEAIGLSKQLVDQYFTGTASRIEGIGLDVIARGSHPEARATRSSRVTDSDTELAVGGNYQYRVRGEYHLLQSADHRQAAARRAAGKLRDVPGIHRPDRQPEPPALHAARRCSNFKTAAEPVPLDEVEPAAEIVKRFATGAMSFGSISQGSARDAGHRHEPHRRQVQHRRGRRRRRALRPMQRRLAAAPSSRWPPRRFGVTTNYLVNADELQIKMAQGAKPGEGGQLPGHKVDETIARVRHSIPGVGLISPPPHHDIYSIEDLAQLIYDLKNVNPQGAHLGEAGRRSRRRHGRRGRRQGARRRRADLRATAAAPALRRSAPSSTPAFPGSSAWPKRSRCW